MNIYQVWSWYTKIFNQCLFPTAIKEDDSIQKHGHEQKINPVDNELTVWEGGGARKLHYG